MHALRLEFGFLAAILLVGQSTSGFAQSVADQPFYYVSGVVLPDGSAAVPSSSYTVQHIKTGKYEIMFTNAFKPLPNCLAVPFAHPVTRLDGLFIFKKGSKYGSSCVFDFADVQTGKLEDTYFTFSAMTISH